MIKIKRYDPKDLGVTDKLIKKLQEETEKAKAHYDEELQKLAADSTYQIKSFSFKAYGQTKPYLIKIYNGKCAYCEASILHGQPGDVEHFRPKSAISTSTDGIESLSDAVKEPEEEEHEIKPGYYWLAADWYNLLLSCNSCNRRSKQLNSDRADGTVISSDTISEETLGKGARFPYIDVKKRVGDPNTSISEEKDVRLLIDPGEDDPEEHLTFIPFTGTTNNLFEFGDEPIPEEKFGRIKALSDKGLASVQIFGLARWTLLQERKKTALHLMSDLTDLKNAVSTFIKANKQLKADPSNEFALSIKLKEEQTISDKMNSLTARFKNSSVETSPSQFLGMKRVILKNWMKDENSIVTTLKNVGVDIERLLIMDIIKDLNLLTRLAIEFEDPHVQNDPTLQELKKSVISKVWESLKEELKSDSQHIEAKKSLINAWINSITNRKIEVIHTLIALNKDPNLLVS